MIRILKKKFSESPAAIMKGDSDKLPLPEGEVDYVFANMYLHHVEDPPVAIKEMTRILKPGGILVITDLDCHDYEFLLTEHHDRWAGFERTDIRQWFEDVGLTDIKVVCAGENCCAGSEAKIDKAEISIFIAAGKR